MSTDPQSESPADATNAVSPAAADAGNPLLAWGEIPDFAAIRVEQVVPAVRFTLARAEADLDALEAVADSLPIGEIVGRSEELEDRLGWTWGLVNHLNSVRTTDALRQAITDVQPEVVTFHSRLGQSEALYRAYSNAEGIADNALARTVELALRAMRHGGVGLTGDAKDQFNANQQQLAQLGMEFGNSLVDATKAWHHELTKEDEMAGAPPSLRGLMAQSAQLAGNEAATPEAGPWRLTLDPTCVMPFLENADRRDLRELIYRAWIGRAGPEGDAKLDNSDRIARILTLRKAQAQLLGFDTFADYSLDAKMAPSVADALALLASLHTSSKPAAQRELAELTDFARSEGATDALALWDVGYWARRLREARYTYSDEDLKPYFPLPRVLEGVIALVHKLFGVEIREGDRTGWHPDVRWFDVMSDGQPIAGFFLDPYSRPADKRGGAWMNELRGRSSRLAPAGHAVRTPIAYLVCNQSAPVGDNPSLMTWNEVSTLFHELGHGLQHMLTRVELLPVAGISGIEWDAVELPSQFMENWLRHPKTLASFAKHYQTSEPIPASLVERVLAASTYRAGSAFLRQIYFARLDLELHHAFDAAGGTSIWEVQRQVASENTVISPLPEDRFLCSFGHLFAGGYAAGYYSYKWAEVLSADAYAAFEEAGLDDDERIAEVGRRFRETVLALGGSVPPMEVFKRFRGREPSTDALLRHNNLG